MSLRKLKNYQIQKAMTRSRILHRKIDLSRATKRLIYSEQFIRYDESKEHEVRKAITTLYKLFGFALTEMRQKAESGRDVIFLSRAMLNLNGNTVHVKTYRPKKYRLPAQSIFDHPKLEVTVYYEKSELPKKEFSANFKVVCYWWLNIITQQNNK